MIASTIALPPAAAAALVDPLVGDGDVQLSTSASTITKRRDYYYQQQQQQQQQTLLPVKQQQQQQQQPQQQVQEQATTSSSYGGAPEYRVGLTRDEAPAWCRYPYVLRGYRCGGTYARCAAALFEWHVETLNAWTMIAGGALSAVLLCRTLAALAAAGALTMQAAAPFALLTGAVLLHMPFSVCFHLFRGISADTYNLWRRLDQAFIFIASVLLAVALGWHSYALGPLGRHGLRWPAVAANGALAVVVAVIAVREIVGLRPHFQRHRGQMVAFVGAAVLSYWLPMAYAGACELAAGRRAYGGALPGPLAALAAGTFAVLQLGGWVFTAGWPERRFPYVFDCCLFSHQLMHVAVVASHALEYAFVWQLAAAVTAAAAAGGAAASADGAYGDGAGAFAAAAGAPPALALA